jgi:hypothetical protein
VFPLNKKFKLYEDENNTTDDECVVRGFSVGVDNIML